MLFNSLAFLFAFLPIVYFVFWRLTTRRQRHVWLALSGYVFYSFWNVKFCLLMFVSTLVSYLAGLGFLRWSDPRIRRWLLVVPIVFDLSLLGFFKYYNFFLDGIDQTLTWFGHPIPLLRLDVLLPVGISFYTFHTITYIVDAYRGVIVPTRSLFEFAAYVSLFPQLVAGPIVRFRQIEKDLDHIDRADRAADSDIGWSFFVIGLAKKVLIADTIAVIINPALATYAELSTLSAWMCAIGYSYQLYFDFSGYSDMAVGLGYLFGLRLPQNFNSLYRATDITDFWRRWHISLSSFLRDYLYIPLGGSHGSRLRTYRNLMITMLLGGLWHGAGWTFVVWGAYHGALLSLNRMGARYWEQVPLWPRRAATFVLVVIGFVVFRSDTMGMAATLLGHMFSWHPGSDIVGRDVLVLVLIVAGAIAHAAPNTFDMRYQWPAPRVAGAVALTAVCLFVLYGSQPAPFLYFQFCMTMGRAIPALLFLVFLADIGARFLPVDPLTFRGWEALSRYRPPGAAFEPNRRYVQARSYGDSAAMGNLPELRQYRPETFTTDARGFRNTTSPGAAPVAAILAGDSFAVGSGVADHDTLSVTLSRQLGCGVYNAGGMDPNPDRLRALAAELGLTNGLVLHAYAEDVDAPTVPPGGKRALNQAIAAATVSVDRAIGLVRGFLLVSPLRILSERAFKRIANDRILPNAYASSVIRGRLRNGDAMLFIAARVARVRGERSVSAAYWVWMQQELQAAGLSLVVVLIPSKYTVYRDLLVDQPPRAAGETGFLNRLEGALAAAGVPVLNLTQPLSAEAAHRAPHHEYLYWRDDIHWNSEGIRLGAAAIQRAPALASLACDDHRATARVVESGSQY